MGLIAQLLGGANQGNDVGRRGHHIGGAVEPGQLAVGSANPRQHLGFALAGSGAPFEDGIEQVIKHGEPLPVGCDGR